MGRQNKVLVHRRKGAWSLTALIGAAVMVTAACSSGSAGSSGNAATGSGSAAAPIKVGSIMAASGSLGDPLFMTAANAWVKWTNAHGGINGHPVQLTVLDDAGDAATSLSEVKQLVQQDHVMAIIGSNSPVATAWGPYIAQQKVPVIGGTSAFFPGEGNYFFPAALGVIDASPITIQLASRIGAKKLAWLYSPGFGDPSEMSELAGTAHLPLYQAEVAVAAPDYTAPCLAVKAAGADLVAVASSGAALEAIAKTCVQNGYTGAFLAPGNADPSWSADSELSKTPIYSIDYTWPFQDQTTPEQTSYFQALNKYAPGALSSPEYNEYVQILWAGMQMFAAAAKAANIGPNSSSADLVNGLYSLHDETLGGLIGPVTYNRADTSHADGCYFVSKLGSGQWTDPFGGQAQCLATSASGAS
jgi:branched-chain amino acid transport system substrate-binding protein